jgi:hypothetical protein
MKTKRLFVIGSLILSFIVLSSVALADVDSPNPTRLWVDPPATTLVKTVREVTVGFRDVKAAEAVGYGLFHGCVSGPQGGAMGIHFVNGNLVGDGELDAQHPEALLYEVAGAKLRLVGVEYVVIADAWDAKHQTPPVLMGQLFNYVGAPNRYGIPAFYELHVWAWKSNPSGVFADWNERVSCEDYVGDAATQGSQH